MVKDKAYYDSLTETIIGCAYKVGSALGYGYLEKVYENSLVIELMASGLKTSQQQSVKVCYEGQVVGDYFVDLMVEDEIVIELKAGKALDESHLAQCLNYLKATQKSLGMLINFGEKKVTVKRVVNGFY